MHPMPEQTDFLREAWSSIHIVFKWSPENLCHRARSPALSGNRVSALARSRMIGSLPFERTIEQTTGTMPLAPNTIAAVTLEDQKNYNLARAAT